MKGIIIYGNPMWGDNVGATYCEYINNASFELTQYAPKEVISCLKGEALESSKAVCSEDDTYDFITGALIALMKMCGVEKVKKAAKETFFDVAENSVNEYEEKIKTLKEKFDKKVADLRDQIHENSRLIQTNGELKDKVKNLKKEKEQIIVAKSILNNKLIEENSNLSYIKSCNESTIESLEKTRDLLKAENEKLKDSCDKYFKEVESLVIKKNELIEENEKLKLDCEKLQHGYNDMMFCGGRACGKQYKALVELFKKMDQKKVDAAYKEAYGGRVIWCSSQSSTRDMLDSLLDSCRYAIPTEFTWELKMPTKREKKWERILELHKENDVIIEVKKEDVKTFLHEIEDKIPEITRTFGYKIFEAKGTIKDIYDELKTHNRIYFRLSKKNKLSYSSDESIYAFKGLKSIDYLPPMRWDLFKKGGLAVKVTYDNYKEFYEACEKVFGKKPMTVYTEDFTVSICKKDGLFEIFTIEDQKKTGRKIIDWEDVR